MASANFPRTHLAKPSAINYHRLPDKMHMTHMFNNVDYRLIIRPLYVEHTWNILTVNKVLSKNQIYKK